MSAGLSSFIFFLFLSISTSALAFSQGDLDLIDGAVIEDAEFGLMLVRPDESWSWYANKSVISARDYVLYNSENDWIYIVLLNKNFGDTRSGSAEGYIKGAIEEAAQSGKEFHVISSEYVDAKYSFLIKAKLVSSEESSLYVNSYVQSINGVTITVMQYPRKGFHAAHLRGFAASITGLPVANNTMTDSHYYKLGRLIGRVFVMAVPVALLIWFLVVLVGVARRR